MARITGVDPAEVSQPIGRVFDKQREAWGAPLANHLVYARRPSIFRGVRAMWAALDESGLIGGRLVSMVNRRVAALNGCVF